jgi:hypothetical protein
VEGEVAEEEGEEDKKIKTVLKLHLKVVDSILAELFRFIWKNNITTTNELICVVQNECIMYRQLPPINVIKTKQRINGLQISFNADDQVLSLNLCNFFLQ